MTWLPTKAGARRLRGLVLLLGLTAFAMTGCIRYELAISINDDGSGVLGTIVAISDVFTQATGSSTEEFVPGDDLPPNVDVREYRQDGFTGIELAIPFANEAELGLITSGMSAGADGGGLDDFTLERNESGGWTFSMVAAVETGEPAAWSSGRGRSPGPSPEELLEGAFFRVRIALPGELAEHNADRVEDGALVWDLDLMATEPRELTARTTAAGPTPPTSGHGPAALEAGVGPADGSATAAAATRAAMAAAGLLAALALLWGFGVRSRRQTRG